MIRAIVLDFDGVILESAAVKTAAFRALFAHHPEHVESIVALHEREVGRSRFWKFATIYETILKQPLSEEASAALGERFTALAYQQVLDSPAVPGLDEFLASNRRALYIASGTPQDELRQIVAERGLGRWFRGVYGSPRGKAEIVRAIMDSDGYRPDEILFVGDGRTDQEGARQSGVFFLGRGEPGPSAPWAAARCIADLRELTSAADRFDRAVPVSVVLCTYNGWSRGYLAAALDSVQAQSVYPEEVLIVDDGSTDGTAEQVLARYPGVRVLRQANLGLAEARNTGIRATTCRYLAFLDDDDRWHPEKLQRQVSAGGAAVYTALTLIDAQGRPVGARRPVAERIGWPEILLGNQIAGPSSVLLERSLLTRCGEFRSGLGGTEDYDYWIRCSRSGPFLGLDLPLVEYRTHAGQMSAGYAAMAEQALRVADEHAARAGEDFRRLVLRYNAYGVLAMGLARGWSQAVRAGWAWSRLAGWDLPLLAVRLLGMACRLWPPLQQRYRRWELEWVGGRLRLLEERS